MFSAELENIRALPFAYRAICENGDLKIRSDNSATFIFRASELCYYKSTSVEKKHRALFTLCSNDPNHLPVNTTEITPECADLKIELQTI